MHCLLNEQNIFLKVQIKKEMNKLIILKEIQFFWVMERILKEMIGFKLTGQKLGSYISETCMRVRHLAW